MILDRQAQAVLDDIAARSEGEAEPSGFDETLRRARSDAAGLARYSAPAPSGVARRDIDAPNASHGSLPSRLYTPDGVSRPPLLVWYHGGGTIAGSLDTHEPVLMALAKACAHAVAAVGYTLAPEAVFPAQHDECLTAARWLAAGRGELGLASEPWAIGGDSIGGLYATATAIALRDEGFTDRPRAQILIYPNTDLRGNRRFPSLDENEGRIMTRGSLEFEASTAVPSEADRDGPRASPLLAADLSDLPPAYLATGEADPLRDEGEAYARRLAQAGVRTEHHRFAGMIHAFLQMNGRIDAAGRLMDEIGAFLRRA